MEKEKQIKVQFRLTDIQEVQFATLCNEWPKGEQQVTNQLQFNAETDARIVRCSAHFEYKQNDITLLLLTVQSIVEFSPESWSDMYQLEEDGWLLPAGLLQHLADLTISAARGILAVRAKENGLPALMIPLIPAAQIIKNNIRFPRKQ